MVTKALGIRLAEERVVSARTGEQDGTTNRLKVNETLKVEKEEFERLRQEARNLEARNQTLERDLAKAAQVCTARQMAGRRN